VTKLGYIGHWVVNARPLTFACGLVAEDAPKDERSVHVAVFRDDRDVTCPRCREEL
jgi:hypothetical protein